MKKFLFLLLLFHFTFQAQTSFKASRTKEEARNFIDSLRSEVIKGASFSAMAGLYSEDPGSAKYGGGLPPFGGGEMVPEFEAVAIKLKTGEISEIFETKYGFHFMMVTGREGDKISARHILISYK